MGIKFRSTFGKASEKFGALGRSIGDIPREVKDELHKFLLRQARETRDDIIESMRKTPRAPWFYVKGKGKRIHHPSLPYNPPAIDEGGLWTHINFDPISKGPDFGIELGTDLKYGAYLEDGTRDGRLLERPWLVPAIKKREPGIISGIERITGEVVERAFRVVERY